jgi:peptidyl-prolyl cis-trans isomerase A (cyclophilin A)
MIKLLLTLALVALPLRIYAQSNDSADANAPASQSVVNVRIETTEGPILVALEQGRAPITTANFLRYVDEKRFDGISFYRAVNVAPGFGLIQGGIRGDARKLLPPIKHEPTTVTGLSHIDGAISMARNAPGTADASFFITVGAIPSMDADPKQPGDNLGFAVFGHVTEGMDIVRHILQEPTSPTEGEGVMKGQILVQPVRIISVRRLP